MTELLPLPKINTRSDIDESLLPTPVEFSEEQLSSILTNMVRQKYFNFLEKLLTDNYENSVTGAVLSCQDIKKCAEYLEFKAVRSCMIVHLYRQSILNTFTEIRSDTAQKKLNINLSTERIFQRKSRRSVQIQTDFRSTPADTHPTKPPKRKLRNVRVQTDFVPSTPGTSAEYTMSLDDRIRMFEKKFRDDDKFAQCFPAKKIDYQNRFKEHRKRRHSSISLESPHSSLDSSIHRSAERTDSTDNEGHLSKADSGHSTVLFATPRELVEATDDTVNQEMMALFGDDEETDIFGEVVGSTDREPATVEHSDEVDETDNNAALIQMDHTATDQKLVNEFENARDYTNELKNSIWPCELHMQRMKLRKALLAKADKGFRYSEKLKRKFVDLFGPEDDDEENNSFAPYSPTIELDEILMSSCKKRIAPWIVKHLTPIGDGLIENRFLFKKVARHIAEKAILRDQYPDEEEIKRAIHDFFKTHNYIGCIDDIT
ncbi:uncharacterized protein LOC119084032 isoform X1 [Bradysia coprophila]|uniref:uncharacterized protein LOC119084032 isoform X1 n=1 Tax=Bradysia coprophila TaxID=38358 RepID=UPI00187D9A39|nr:uncharacterized protein LOC119084032 isoform X1 [Bradysia coprophila]